MGKYTFAMYLLPKTNSTTTKRPYMDYVLMGKKAELYYRAVVLNLWIATPLKNFYLQKILTLQLITVAKLLL